MEFKGTKISADAVHYHLRSPPIGRKQVENDANIPPQPKLINSLVPGVYGEDVRPPRLEFGCFMNHEHILKIAEKFGYAITPVDRLVTAPTCMANSYVKSKLYRDLDELEMTYELVYTGLPNSGNNEHFRPIYSFCSNYALKTYPTKENLCKLLDMLELERSGLKWWVSCYEWCWKRVDLKRERLVNQVHEFLLAEEWAGVLARADANEARVRKAAKKRKQKKEKAVAGA